MRIFSTKSPAARKSHDSVHLLTHILLLMALVVENVQSIDDVWRALELPDGQEMAKMMTSYQMQMRALDDNNNAINSIDFDSRGLQEGEASSKLGARCSNRDTCVINSNNNSTIMDDIDLQCTNVAFGKRCLPMTCLEQGLADAQNTQSLFGGNVEDYQQVIFDAAGVTKDDLRQALQGIGNDKRNFLQTSVFQSLQRALEDHAVPAETIFGLYDNCTTTTTTATGDTPTPFALDRVTYLGLHLEGGVFPLDVAFDVFWEYRGDGSAFVRYCIGLAGPVGAEISFLYLIAQNTDDVDEIAETCSVVYDVDFGIGAILGVGYGHGLANGLGQLELTAGIGLKVSAGVGFCGVSKA